MSLGSIFLTILYVDVVLLGLTQALFVQWLLGIGLFVVWGVQYAWCLEFKYQTIHQTLNMPKTLIASNTKRPKGLHTSMFGALQIFMHMFLPGPMDN